MAGGIDSPEVERDHVRPTLPGRGQPFEHLVDPRLVRHAGIEASPVRRLDPPDRCLAPDPVEGRRDHALGLRGDPDGLAPVPRAVFHGRPVGEGVRLAPRRVVEAVADEAMRIRIHPGGDRIVIGEGHDREYRDQAPGRDAPVGEPAQVRRREEVQVVVTEAVDGNHHDVRLLEVDGLIDAARALRAVEDGWWGRVGTGRRGRSATGQKPDRSERDGRPETPRTPDAFRPSAREPSGGRAARAPVLPSTPGRSRCGSGFLHLPPREVHRSPRPCGPAPPPAVRHSPTPDCAHARHTGQRPPDSGGARGPSPAVS